MKSCPACGRTFFLTARGRARHIEWENEQYRKKLYREHPDAATRLGILPDGTLGGKE